MIEYQILVSSSESFNTDTATFFEIIGGTCWVTEIGNHPETRFPLNYTKFNLTDKNTVIHLYGKFPGMHIRNLLEATWKGNSQPKYLHGFIGYLILVNVELKHFPEEKNWLINLPDRSTYDGVNNAKLQLKELRKFVPHYPVVVASYNHHLPEAMTADQLKWKLNLTDDEPLIPIDLTDKQKIIRVIHRLIQSN